jgi:hypothetical protein
MRFPARLVLLALAVIASGDGTEHSRSRQGPAARWARAASGDTALPELAVASAFVGVARR